MVVNPSGAGFLPARKASARRAGRARAGTVNKNPGPPRTKRDFWATQISLVEADAEDNVDWVVVNSPQMYGQGNQGAESAATSTSSTREKPRALITPGRKKKKKCLMLLVQED